MTSAARSAVARPRLNGEPAAGRLGLHRALPSGRAVAGGFLVAAAAVVVFSAWLAGHGPSGRPWIIASRDLAAGTRLGADDLATATMQLPRAAAGTHAFADTRELVGRTLAAPLQGGDLVQNSSLVPIGHQPAVRPVPVTVAAPDLAPLVPGQMTVVLVTDGSGGAATTSVVVRGATVLGVSRPTNSLVGTGEGGVVILGVRDLVQAEAIVHAEHTGTLTVIVGEPSDGEGLGSSSGTGGGRPGATTGAPTPTSSAGGAAPG